MAKVIKFESEHANCIKRINQIEINKRKALKTAENSKSKKVIDNAYKRLYNYEIEIMELRRKMSEL